MSSSLNTQTTLTTVGGVSTKRLVMGPGDGWWIRWRRGSILPGPLTIQSKWKCGGEVKFVSDSEFLHFLEMRLVNVYGESPNVDFCYRLRKIGTRLFRQEELEELTRVEMERLEKERGDEKSCVLLDKKGLGG